MIIISSIRFYLVLLHLVRYSTSYHNKAICRRIFILYALFGGHFCFPLFSFYSHLAFYLAPLNKTLPCLCSIKHCAWLASKRSFSKSTYSPSSSMILRLARCGSRVSVIQCRCFGPFVLRARFPFCLSLPILL